MATPVQAVASLERRIAEAELQAAQARRAAEAAETEAIRLRGASALRRRFLMTNVAAVVRQIATDEREQMHGVSLRLTDEQILGRFEAQNLVVVERALWLEMLAAVQATGEAGEPLEAGDLCSECHAEGHHKPDCSCGRGSRLTTSALGCPRCGLVHATEIGGRRDACEPLDAEGL